MTHHNLLSVLAAMASLPSLASAVPNAVVALDGSGNYSSIGEAIAKAPQLSSAAHPWIIHVKPGIYRELLYVQREKRFVHLVGEDSAKTVITYNLAPTMLGPDGKGIGTFRTATAFLDADDFTVENITFENSAGKVGPALAIRIDGDRDVFVNCRFLGFQDTILLDRGRQYFENCSISGATDFIFGGATAFFDQCQLHCTANGYVTAASTPKDEPFGFVFFHCSIVGDSPGIKTCLGRPWRAFASVTFVNSEMTDVVQPAGWSNWGDATREKTARYAEFQTTGSGAAPSQRVPWAKQVSSDDAAKISVDSVLGGSDNWKPSLQQ